MLTGVPTSSLTLSSTSQTPWPRSKISRYGCTVYQLTAQDCLFKIDQRDQVVDKLRVA